MRPPKTLLEGLRRFNGALPIALKLLLPIAVIIGITSAAYSLVVLPLVRTELEQAYAEQARKLAAVVQAAYSASSADPLALNEFVRGVVALDGSVRRIRIYRVTAAGPVTWASSDATEVGTYRPDAHDIAPLRTGATTQVTEVVDGSSVLETLEPLRINGVLYATVGIYMSLDPLEAVVRGTTRVVLVAGASAGALVLLAAGFVLHFVVLRPIRRLQQAALRLASGDLSLPLSGDNEADAKDEIVSVTRAFDRMARTIVQQRAEAERLAMTDGLTSLLNRRSFDLRLEDEVRRAPRLRYPLVVSIVDLDGFKDLNDSRGHQAGDDALRRVAGALLEIVRGTDVVARYGGDEFALVQPDCDRAAARLVAERIRRGIEQLGIVADQRSGRQLGASVGSAEWQAGQTSDALVAEADRALYAAKARGGGIAIAGLDPA